MDVPLDAVADELGRITIGGCGKGAQSIGWIARVANAVAWDTSFGDGGALRFNTAGSSCVGRVARSAGSTFAWYTIANAGTTSSYIRKLDDAGGSRTMA